MQIRDANISDIEQLQIVAKNTWKHTYEGIFSLGAILKFMELAYSTEALEQAIRQAQSHNGICFKVAQIDGKVVGFAQVNETDVGYEIMRIYVLPDYQNQQAGSQLLHEMEWYICQHKRNGEQGKQVKLFVNVEKENETGRRFYQNKGFEEIEELDDDFFGEVGKLVKCVKEIACEWQE